MNTDLLYASVSGVYGEEVRRYAKVIACTAKKMELLEQIRQSKVGENFRVDAARVSWCVFTEEEAEAAFLREATRLVSELTRLNAALKGATKFSLLDRFYKRDKSQNFYSSDGVLLFEEIRDNLGKLLD